MPKPNYDENTIIDDVALTKRAIEFIKQLQKEDNEFLKEICEELHNAVSILIDILDDDEACSQCEVLNEIKYLNTFLKNFKLLMKPE